MGGPEIQSRQAFEETPCRLVLHGRGYWGSPSLGWAASSSAGGSSSCCTASPFFKSTKTTRSATTIFAVCFWPSSPFQALVLVRPTIRTREPFLSHWLQISASEFHVWTVNHSVSLTFWLSLVKEKLDATENVVTGWPAGV